MPTRTVTVRIEAPQLPVLVGRIRAAATVAMVDCLLRLSAEAARNAPVNTGLLRSSIQPMPIRHDAAGISGVVAARVAYARWMEFGTIHGRKMPPDAPIRRWVQLKGIATAFGTSVDSATFLVRRAIRDRGLAPRRFMERAEITLQPACERAIGDAVIRAAQAQGLRRPEMRA